MNQDTDWYADRRSKSYDRRVRPNRTDESSEHRRHSLDNKSPERSETRVHQSLSGDMASQALHYRNPGRESFRYYDQQRRHPDRRQTGATSRGFDRTSRGRQGARSSDSDSSRDSYNPPARAPFQRGYFTSKQPLPYTRRPQPGPSRTVSSTSESSSSYSPSLPTSRDPLEVSRSQPTYSGSYQTQTSVDVPPYNPGQPPPSFGVQSTLPHYTPGPAYLSQESKESHEKAIMDVLGPPVPPPNWDYEVTPPSNVAMGLPVPKQWPLDPPAPPLPTMPIELQDSPPPPPPSPPPPSSPPPPPPPEDELYLPKPPIKNIDWHTPYPLDTHSSQAKPITSDQNQPGPSGLQRTKNVQSGQSDSLTATKKNPQRESFVDLTLDDSSETAVAPPPSASRQPEDPNQPVRRRMTRFDSWRANMGGFITPAVMPAPPIYDRAGRDYPTARQYEQMKAMGMFGGTPIPYVPIYYGPNCNISSYQYNNNRRWNQHGSDRQRGGGRGGTRPSIESTQPEEAATPDDVSPTTSETFASSRLKEPLPRELLEREELWRKEFNEIELPYNEDSFASFNAIVKRAQKRLLMTLICCSSRSEFIKGMQFFTELIEKNMERVPTPFGKDDLSGKLYLVTYMSEVIWTISLNFPRMGFAGAELTKYLDCAVKLLSVYVRLIVLFLNDETQRLRTLDAIIVARPAIYLISRCLLNRMDYIMLCIVQSRPEFGMYLTDRFWNFVFWYFLLRMRCSKERDEDVYRLYVLLQLYQQTVNRTAYRVQTNAIFSQRYGDLESLKRTNKFIKEVAKKLEENEEYINRDMIEDYLRWWESQASQPKSPALIGACGVSVKEIAPDPWFPNLSGLPSQDEDEMSVAFGERFYTIPCSSGIQETYCEMKMFNIGMDLHSVRYRAIINRELAAIFTSEDQDSTNDEQGSYSEAGPSRPKSPGSPVETVELSDDEVEFVLEESAVPSRKDKDILSKLKRLGCRCEVPIAFTSDTAVQISASPENKNSHTGSPIVEPTVVDVVLPPEKPKSFVDPVKTVAARTTTASRPSPPHLTPDKPDIAPIKSDQREKEESQHDLQVHVDELAILEVSTVKSRTSPETKSVGTMVEEDLKAKIFELHLSVESEAEMPIEKIDVVETVETVTGESSHDDNDILEDVKVRLITEITGPQVVPLPQDQTEVVSEALTQPGSGIETTENRLKSDTATKPAELTPVLEKKSSQSDVDATVAEQPHIQVLTSSSGTVTMEDLAPEAQPEVRVEKLEVGLEQPEVCLEEPDLRVEEPNLHVKESDVRVKEPDVRVEESNISVPPAVRVKIPVVGVEKPDVRVKRSDVSKSIRRAVPTPEDSPLHKRAKFVSQPPTEPRTAWGVDENVPDLPESPPQEADAEVQAQEQDRPLETDTVGTIAREVCSVATSAGSEYPPHEPDTEIKAKQDEPAKAHDVIPVAREVSLISAPGGREYSPQEPDTENGTKQAEPIERDNVEIIASEISLISLAAEPVCSKKSDTEIDAVRKIESKDSSVQEPDTVIEATQVEPDNVEIIASEMSTMSLTAEPAFSQQEPYRELAALQDEPVEPGVARKIENKISSISEPPSSRQEPDTEIVTMQKEPVEPGIVRRMESEVSSISVAVEPAFSQQGPDTQIAIMQDEPVEPDNARRSESEMPSISVIAEPAYSHQEPAAETAAMQVELDSARRSDSQSSSMSMTAEPAYSEQRLDTESAVMQVEPHRSRGSESEISSMSVSAKYAYPQQGLGTEIAPMQVAPTDTDNGRKAESEFSTTSISLSTEAHMHSSGDDSPSGATSLDCPDIVSLIVESSSSEESRSDQVEVQQPQLKPTAEVLHSFEREPYSQVASSERSSGANTSEDNSVAELQPESIETDPEVVKQSHATGDTRLETVARTSPTGDSNTEAREMFFKLTGFLQSNRSDIKALAVSHEKPKLPDLQMVSDFKALLNRFPPEDSDRSAIPSAPPEDRAPIDLIKGVVKALGRRLEHIPRDDLPDDFKQLVPDLIDHTRPEYITAMVKLSQLLVTLEMTEKKPISATDREKPEPAKSAPRRRGTGIKTTVEVEKPKGLRKRTHLVVSSSSSSDLTPRRETPRGKCKPKLKKKIETVTETIAPATTPKVTELSKRGVVSASMIAGQRRVKAQRRTPSKVTELIEEDVTASKQFTVVSEPTPSTSSTKRKRLPERETGKRKKAPAVKPHEVKRKKSDWESAADVPLPESSSENDSCVTKVPQPSEGPLSGKDELLKDNVGLLPEPQLALQEDSAEDATANRQNHQTSDSSRSVTPLPYEGLDKKKVQKYFNRKRRQYVRTGTCTDEAGNVTPHPQTTDERHVSTDHDTDSSALSSSPSDVDNTASPTPSPLISSISSSMSSLSSAASTSTSSLVSMDSFDRSLNLRDPRLAGKSEIAKRYQMSCEAQATETLEWRESFEDPTVIYNESFCREKPTEDEKKKEIAATTCLDFYNSFGREVSVDVQEETEELPEDGTAIELEPDVEGATITVNLRHIMNNLKQEDGENGVVPVGAEVVLPETQVLLTPPQTWSLDQNQSMEYSAAYKVQVTSMSGSQSCGPQTASRRLNPHGIDSLLQPDVAPQRPEPQQPTAVLRPVSDSPTNVLNMTSGHSTTKSHSVSFFEQRVGEIYAQEFGQQSKNSTSGLLPPRLDTTKKNETPAYSWRDAAVSSLGPYNSRPKTPAPSNKSKVLHVTAEDSDLFNAFEGPVGKPHRGNLENEFTSLLWNETGATDQQQQLQIQEVLDSRGVISVKPDSRLIHDAKENLVSILKKTKAKGDNKRKRIQFENQNQIEEVNITAQPADLAVNTNLVIKLKRCYVPEALIEMYKKRQRERHLEYKRRRQQQEMQAAHQRAMVRAREMEAKERQMSHKSGFVCCIFSDKIQADRFEEDDIDDHPIRNHRFGERFVQKRKADDRVADTSHKKAKAPKRVHFSISPNGAKSITDEFVPSDNDTEIVTKSGRLKRKPSGKDYYDVTKMHKVRHKPFND